MKDYNLYPPFAKEAQRPAEEHVKVGGKWVPTPGEGGPGAPKPGPAGTAAGIARQGGWTASHHQKPKRGSGYTVFKHPKIKGELQILDTGDWEHVEVRPSGDRVSHASSVRSTSPKKDSLKKYMDELRKGS